MTTFVGLNEGREQKFMETSRKNRIYTVLEGKLSRARSKGRTHVLVPLSDLAFLINNSGYKFPSIQEQYHVATRRGFKSTNIHISYLARLLMRR